MVAVQNDCAVLVDFFLAWLMVAVVIEIDNGNIIYHQCGIGVIPVVVMMVYHQCGVGVVPVKKCHWW